MTKRLSLSCLVFVLVSLLWTVSVHAFKLPDTGQTKCYQGYSTEIPCGGTGQDGAYNINPMSFTDNGDGTVTDNNTKLMWQQGWGGYYDWFTAPSVCSGLTLSGYTDWRLPITQELMSIVNYGIPFPGPTIDTTYFPNTDGAFYWSIDFAAWGVNFREGWVRNDWWPAEGTQGIRCVRGEPLASGYGYFRDNGNGTVTDISTGLIWQQGESGPLTWQNALYHCMGLAINGEGGWRLPNVKELQSMRLKGTPAIFPYLVPIKYWSSTVYAGSPTYAWTVNFSNGFVIDASTSEINEVRCVRGGESPGEAVDISKLGNGTGTVASWPAGINCGGACWALFPINSTVVLSSTPDFGGSIFSGWGGDIDCYDGMVTVERTKLCTATFDFCQGNPVRIGLAEYISIWDAYSNGATVSGDTIIEVIASNRGETLDLNQGKVITLIGGNDCQFVPLLYSFTTITGSLTISTGSVAAHRIALQ